MKFKLIDNGDSVRSHDKDILKKTILNIKQEEEYFIVLEPKEPIDNSVYMQVSVNEGKYLIETRLMFDSEDRYKHYSKNYSSINELVEIFNNYYLKLQLPDLRSWNDETATDDEEDNKLVKLYKKSNEIIYYFETWINEDKSLTIHKGKLGEIGEVENIVETKDNQAPSIQIHSIIQKYRDNGYAEYTDLVELIIQYAATTRGHKYPDIEDVENNLNNCLGWTGNGHCEGADLYDKIATLYCYTIDKEIATETIVESLEDQSLLSDTLKIAYADEHTGEYKLLYPNEGTFII